MDFWSNDTSNSLLLFKFADSHFRQTHGAFGCGFRDFRHRFRTHCVSVSSCNDHDSGQLGWGLPKPYCSMCTMRSRSCGTTFGRTKMSNAGDTQKWPDLAIGLYDKLTGRNAEISYSFDDLELSIPSSTSADPKHATWKMNGTVRITTRNADESNA